MSENGVNVDTRPDGSLLKLSGWGKAKSAIRGLVLIAVTLLIFCLLFRQIDLDSVLELLAGVPPLVWVSATLLTFSFPIISALRWRLVLRTMGFDVPVARCLLIIIGIWPLSAISPSKAGDLLKAVSLRNEIRPAIVAGGVLAERVLDVLTLALLALGGGLVLGDVRIIAVGALATGGISVIILIAHLKIKLPGGPKLRATLEDLFRTLTTLRSKPGLFAGILALTAANWIATIVQTKVLFLGVGADVPLGFTATALPVAIFAGLLPITFAGMATRDSAMVVLFAAFATAPQALATGILYSFFGYWLLAVAGIPFIKRALNL
ncbi:MAG: lysylphosphatidylglycerol synthase transmembrane domain-containing protein [Syntrophobacteraceae bacterium]